MQGGLPSEAAGAFVGVLIYSILCLIPAFLLVCLLISYGEKWTYVTIHSTFTLVATLASIIQQLHYAVAWRVIKEARFENAIRALTEKGLAFGGAAHPVDVTLFFIQFWCYNTMALNTLFWAIALFVGAWGYGAKWLGDWYPRIGPISKIFAMVFPSIIIGIMNAPAVRRSAPGTFVVSNITIISSLSTGSALMILILYKYMKTRQLASGSVKRGRWWASDNKSAQSRDGSHYTLETGQSSTIRRSIYDRALVTRFTIGFILLAVFLAALVTFSFVSSTTNSTVAKSGSPDFSVNGTIVDIVLFIPGVTASLVTFLVFGTAKSWRQYRELITKPCSNLRKRRLERSIDRDEQGQEEGLEFERLPSLTNTPSAKERTRNEEAKSRIRMFSREIRTPTISTPPASMSNQTRPRSVGPSFHRPKNSNENANFQFHIPRPSLQLQRHQESLSLTSAEIHVGMQFAPDDQVVQSGSGEVYELRRMEHMKAEEQRGRSVKRNTEWPK